jgi:hypothetical protein
MAKVIEGPVSDYFERDPPPQPEEAAMSPERTHAYRRVLQTITDLGPSKLQSGEQDRIRYAADNLIFCADLTKDDAAREALSDTRLLLDTLVESGRWERVTADRLADDVVGCGPLLALELEAA